MAQEMADIASGTAVLDLPLADTVPVLSPKTPEISPKLAGISPKLDGAGLEQVANVADRLVLPLEALLPDSDGAVVLDDIMSAEIDLAGTVGVTERGIVEANIEAAGRDVTGHAYVALENGVTLYYPPDADIMVG